MHPQPRNIGLLLVLGTMVGLAAPAAADLKCPFTGSPPNYECPPAPPQNPPPPPPDFKDEFDDEDSATVGIPALTAATEAGGAMEVAVLLPAELIPLKIQILDWHTGAPLPELKTPRRDRLVTWVYGDGLPGGGTSAQHDRVPRSPHALEATGYSAYARDSIRSGFPIRIEVTIALAPWSELGPTGVARLLTGNLTIISGERAPDADVGDPRRWERIAVLRRSVETTESGDRRGARGQYTDSDSGH